MWGYYGAKGRIVESYPKPKFNKIIEPFAGTARYSLRHFEKEVLLIEKYGVLVDIWKWLQLCSPSDIQRLPRLNGGDKVDDFTYDCTEARNLMGFLAGYSMSQPRKTVSASRLSIRPNHINFAINRIADDLFKIKHWDIRLGDYRIGNEEATWFIDPPYQFGGHYYKFGNKGFDFQELAAFCERRKGQVIVCENDKADWMDFKPLVSHQGAKGKQNEVIWTNG